MIDRLIAEATECDFKVALRLLWKRESRKAGSKA